MRLELPRPRWRLTCTSPRSNGRVARCLAAVSLRPPSAAIVGIGSEAVRRAGGVDAVQALELGVQKALIDVEHLRRRHPEIRWEADDPSTASGSGGP